MRRPYAEVIGDPVAHSKSPVIHQFWLDKLGLDGEYRAFQVKPSDLMSYLQHRREDSDWRGCNVTMPHKVNIAAHLDRLFPTAKLLGAVNTVKRNGEGRLSGDNTDTRGFSEPFRDQHHGRGTALLLGTGGAARAIFIALAALNFKPIHVMARSAASGREFLKSLNQRSTRSLTFADPIPSVHLVVNATSLGMLGGEPLLVDLEALPPTAVVYDIVYAPLDTQLLKQARTRGLKVVDGLSMLIGQAAAAFPYFFDGEPPREHDAELRALLTSKAF